MNAINVILWKYIWQSYQKIKFSKRTWLNNSDGFHERIEKIVLGRRYTLSPDVLHKLALYCLFKNNPQKISNKRLSLTSCAINYMSEFVTWSKMSSTQCSPLQTLAIQLCPVAQPLYPFLCTIFSNFLTPFLSCSWKQFVLHASATYQTGDL